MWFDIVLGRYAARWVYNKGGYGGLGDVYTLYVRPPRLLCMTDISYSALSTAGHYTVATRICDIV